MSGLLIGAEIADGADEASEPITVIGSAKLAARYAFAAGELGLAATTAADDVAVPAYLDIARKAGLVSPTETEEPT